MPSGGGASRVVKAATPILNHAAPAVQQAAPVVNHMVQSTVPAVQRTAPVVNHVVQSTRPLANRVRRAVARVRGAATRLTPGSPSHRLPTGRRPVASSTGPPSSGPPSPAVHLAARPYSTTAPARPDRVAEPTAHVASLSRTRGPSQAAPRSSAGGHGLTSAGAPLDWNPAFAAGLLQGRAAPSASAATWAPALTHYPEGSATTAGASPGGGGGTPAAALLLLSILAAVIAGRRLVVTADRLPRCQFVLLLERPG